MSNVTIIAASLAPERFPHRDRTVFLQPAPPGHALVLAPGRAEWKVVRADGFVTFQDHSSGAFLSVDAAGTVVDTFPVDDGSGRQRWVMEDLGNGVVAIRVHSGMNDGARYLSRLGNLKTKLRPGHAADEAHWKVSETAAASPAAPAAPTPSGGPLAARDVLLGDRNGRALPLMRESGQFCIYANTGDLAKMQETCDTVERVWQMYQNALGFKVRGDVQVKQGWDRFKKTLYLSGAPPPGPCCSCPESGHGYEWQGWTKDGTHAFLCTGGFGDGCLSHELAHLMQVGTGGFTWGGPSLPWAFESSAQFCRWFGADREEDWGSLKPWLEHHATSIERHDGSPQCYQYGSWLWWMFMDREFGAGTVGRVWSESVQPETPLQACARVSGVALPDLFARFVGSCVSSSWRGERWDRVWAQVGHPGGAWSTFDRLEETPGGYTARGLERCGFHALRLSDASRRGPHALTLRADNSDWRMVVAIDGKVRAILRAGETSSEKFPVAKCIVGVCCTHGEISPKQDEIRYEIDATA